MKTSSRLGMAIAATLLVTGCDHDGDSNDQVELSGVFQAGDVSGVRYQTPTRDGITDASGTFKYLAGETVTFSIGGIRLGSVPGAPAVTPFTLAGLSPPTTERALRRELDRAIRTTSNFVHAVNIDRLLLALDADNNPANGIDVRGRESALANANIDFDQGLPNFAASLERLAPNLTHNLPRWYPIVHLYNALGIVVPAHAPVQYESDDTTFFTRHSIVTYYPDGSRESENNTDGFEGNVFSTTHVYDALGRTTASRIVSVPLYQTGFTQEERWSFDARGTVTGSVHEHDEGADGVVEFRSTESYEFDAFNNLLHQHTRHADNDDVVYQLFDYRVTYDAHLNPTRTVSETDSGADGTVDSRWSSDSEFDSRNRLVARRTDFDEYADGIVNSRDTMSIAYAPGDRDVVEIYELDSDANGVPDQRLTYRWDFDAAGALRTRDESQEYDVDDDGDMDSRSNLRLTYDRDARPLSEVQTQDSDIYTDVPVNTRRTFTYADHGGPLRVEMESDVGGDGDVDARYTTEYEYGAGGELLTIRNTSESVLVGFPTNAGTTQVTNVPMADGVRMLAQQYFEIWYSLGQVSTD